VEQEEKVIRSFLAISKYYDALDSWLGDLMSVELNGVGRSTKEEPFAGVRNALAINDRVYMIRQIRNRLQSLRVEAQAKERKADDV